MQQVLVSGDNHHPAVVPGKTSDGRGDQVIRLLVLMFHGQDIVGIDNPVNIGYLHRQVIGHRRPVGLVLRINPVPENRPSRVPGNGQTFGVFLPENTAKNGGKAVNGMGGKPGAGRQWPDGMIGPVYIGAAVNKIHLSHGSHLRSQASG